MKPLHVLRNLCLVWGVMGLSSPFALAAQSNGQSDTTTNKQQQNAKTPKLSQENSGQSDSVSSPATSVQYPASGAITADDFNELNAEICETLDMGQSFTWSASSQPLTTTKLNNPTSTACKQVAASAKTAGGLLYSLGQYAFSKNPSCTGSQYDVNLDKVVIFHIVYWNASGSLATSPQLTSSTWYLYRHPRYKGDNILVPLSLTGTGDPLLYAKKHLLIVNIDIPNTGTNLQSTITAPVTAGTSDLSSDISALFSALTGISGSSAAYMAQTIGGTPPKNIFVATACQDGPPKQNGKIQLPFSVQIADAAASATTPANNTDPLANQNVTSMGAHTGAGATAQHPGQTQRQPTGPTGSTASGTVTCSGTGNSVPCTMGRTYTSKEHAYLDVSAGVSIPGARDASYTFSTTTSTVSSSVTRHTDAYGLIDVFPLGYFLPKESWVPHANFGIPVTSQSLHRPYVGMAENLTGWTHLQKKFNLPIAVNIFGGVVFMKTEKLTGTPTTQAEFNSALSRHWVRKSMFGIEVPISSVTSKFSKGGK